MSFTYNIGIVMTAGFVVYPLFKTAAGKAGDLQPGMRILGLLSLLFFLFYPNESRNCSLALFVEYP